MERRGGLWKDKDCNGRALCHKSVMEMICSGIENTRFLFPLSAQGKIPVHERNSLGN